MSCKKKSVAIHAMSRCAASSIVSLAYVLDVCVELVGAKSTSVLFVANAIV